jgi:tetratricopeptide (TPR) repeat protein
VKDVYITKDSKAIVNAFSFFEQIILGAYAYTVYILKFFIPYATATLYPMPELLQWGHWAGAVLAVLIFTGSLAVWRKYRFITFGLLFFTFNIFFLLMPFLANDSAFLHDRYIYVAYIGLSFVIAAGAQKLSEKLPSSRLPAACLAVFVLLIFSIMTIKYIPAWKNSETLWTYVIEKYPRKIAMAYIKRGHYWYKNNLPGKAIEDFSTAIDINPENILAYQSRGLTYLVNNDIFKALPDYNRYLELMSPFDISGNELNIPVSDALGNRGLIFSKMSQYEKALIDFDMAIKLNPQNPNNYLNRAFAYYKLGLIDKAKQDVQTIEKMGALVDPSFRTMLQHR